MPRPATFSRPEVVESAKSVFSRKGYNRTSMQDLVKATGLHPGSLYGAFSNKENLFNECIKTDLKKMFDLLEETFATHESAYKGLETYFLLHWNDSLDATELANHRFIFRASIEVDDELPESWRLITEAIERRSAIVTAHIAAGQEDGDIRDDLPATEINSFLTMGSLGLRCMQQLHPSELPKRRCVEFMLEFIKPKTN